MVADTSVRAARRAAGSSQAQLADWVGGSRRAVGAIERGLHRPSVDAALAIGAAVEEPSTVAPQAAAASIFGDAPADGGPPPTARVGDRVAHAPASGALGFAAGAAPTPSCTTTTCGR